MANVGLSGSLRPTSDRLGVYSGQPPREPGQADTPGGGTLLASSRQFEPNQHPRSVKLDPVVTE
ncbi:hypothetical protein PHLCEN_2v5672 [Hermanssonia centrifuga]|uniref:Uncharacterized protein n=1 Tax=Hermanssonia centrifuga TaxID=98765 RepID=A0A2R6P1S7_9APHY|nr:hypothetical protein PHLCEN_2v5672 [Hermanssonia centrifuga]